MDLIMKRLAILCLVLFGAVAGVPAPGHGAFEGYCIDDFDCKTGECCVLFENYDGDLPLIDGDLPPIDLMTFVDGVCKDQADTEQCM